MTSSPTVRRRRLGSELRRLRERAGKKIEEVAAFVECGTNTVSRYETGRGAVKLIYVEKMLEFYGIDDEARAALLTIARESRQKGWWQAYDDVLPPWFEVYVGLEEAASSLRVFEDVLIHGLLQTEAYARAVFRTTTPAHGDDEIERQVALRINRQKLLTRDTAPTAWFVLDEAVLRRPIADTPVMAAQLRHLISVARLPNVELQILPNTAGVHSAIRGPYVILGFPEQADPDVVYLEALTSAFYLERPAETETYTLVFDHLRAAALSPRDSLKLLAKVSKEMG